MSYMPPASLSDGLDLSSPDSHPLRRTRTMPAPTTPADFLDLCRKSGVVEDAQLALLTGPATDSPAAVARALIRTGVLTKFQAAQLLVGKYKGLKFDRLKILDRLGAGGMG